MNFKSTLGMLRLAALLEGISYLLFAVTMPLKYQYHMDLPNKIVGNIHGFLFIGYVILVYLVAKEKNWPLKEKLIAYVASLLPFATFIADFKYFKKYQ